MRDYASYQANRKQAWRDLMSPQAWLLLLVGTVLLLILAVVLHHRHQQQKQSANNPVVLRQELAHTQRPPHKLNAEDTEEIQYDFYSLLPKMQVVVSATDEQAALQAQAQMAAPENATYFLQVASFRDVADADNVKAKLSSLGFTVTVKAGQAFGQRWNRVYVGPYDSKHKALSAQTKLLDKNYNSLLVRAAS